MVARTGLVSALALAQMFAQGSARHLSQDTAVATCTGEQACRAGLETFLTSKVSDVLSNPDLTSACGNVLALAQVLVGSCKNDLLSASDSCPCSTECTSAVAQLPDGCFDALTTVLCGLVPEAYAAGVDLYGVMESASTQCYKPGEAKAELSCGADVVPKVVTAATDCTALASAPVRAPAGAPAPAPAAPVKAKAAPVAAPPALAPAPVAAQVAAAAPAPVPGAVALAECTPAECRDGLTDYLVANASALAAALDGCGSDFATIAGALATSCSEDLAWTGGCNCSAACKAAVADVPLACVEGLQSFVCDNGAAARDAGVELVDTMTELVEKCYYAPLGIAPAALPDTCDGISAFDPIAVCGPGADPVPVEAGPFAWLGVAAMTLLPCLF